MLLKNISESVAYIWCKIFWKLPHKAYIYKFIYQIFAALRGKIPLSYQERQIPELKSLKKNIDFWIYFLYFETLRLECCMHACS